MRKFTMIFAVAGILGLAGCGSPLAKLPTLADVDIATDAPSVEALPSENEKIEARGLVGRLFKPNDQPSPEVAAVQSATTSVQELQTESALVPTAPQSPEIANDTVVAEPPAKRGILGRIGGVFGRDTSKPNIESGEPIASADAPIVETEVEIAEVDTVAAEPEPLSQPEEEPRRFGVFGRAEKREAETAEQEPIRTASIAPTRGLRGLFKSTPERTGPDAELVSYGTALPYGKIATVCGLTKSQLGTKVDTYPSKGKGYSLYDSNPSGGGLRTHYLTGFKDGCARQFTSALALFGSVETHQSVRYKKSNNDLSYSNSDTAFENVKSKVCKVPKGTACSDAGTKKLDKSMVFVSVYERFGTSPRWADILLYDGVVLAKDFKGR